MAESVCRRCREDIAADADRCPHCQYGPEGTFRRRAWWGAVVGSVLTFTIIGAVLGLPLLVVALYWYIRAGMATPVAKGDSDA